jgi:hypothetical protein
VHVLPGSAHLLAIDVDRDRCADEVLGFVETPAPGKAIPQVSNPPSGRE